MITLAARIAAIYRLGAKHPLLRPQAGLAPRRAGYRDPVEQARREALTKEKTK